MTSLRASLNGKVGRLQIDVELDTAPGTLVVVGPNGAGKSSLLAFLLGARAVEVGRISLGATLLLDTAAGYAVPLEQRRLGYVPQDYALFPHLSVRGNVEFAMRSAAPELSPAERSQEVELLLHELALVEQSARRPRALSGGERQRAALARALGAKPRALLLDEPLGALDVHARREVRDFLARYLRKLGLPTLIVTHDARDAQLLGQRIAVLEAGRITQLGSWAELAARPASAFVAELVSSSD
jgi:molybdate transport system ATP-binding protein